MDLHKKIESEIDNTVKYVFRLDDGLYTELSYIDKGDGKAIICVSTHTGCDYKCKFCHLTTDRELQKMRKIDWIEMHSCIGYIIGDSGIKDVEQKTLLISFMGVGEPLLNVRNIVLTCIEVKRIYTGFKNVRFAISTMIPFNKLQELYRLADAMTDMELKIHYSLHAVSTTARKKLLPYALGSRTALYSLDYIQNIYKNISVEIHYTLMKNEVGHIGWDQNKDWQGLANISRKFNMPVKFLKLSEKQGFENRTITEEEYKEHVEPIFEHTGEHVEYYAAPGHDVGASCGQISQEVYEVK